MTVPPRRANRHQNVEALYRREEAEQMEQRINEKFDEGIGKLEKLMIDMNQGQRRRSPISNHGGNRVSPSVTEARRVSPQSVRERRESSVSTRRDHHEFRDEERRTQREFGDEPYRDIERQSRRDMHDHRDVDGRDRYRSPFDYDEESDRCIAHYRDRDQVRNAYREVEDDRRWESGMKMEISEFKGGMVAEEFLDWLSNVEEIFDFKEVPEHRRVKLVATRLRGRAMAWWQQTKLTRERMGKSKIATWEKMKKLMKATFLSYNYQFLMYQRLQNLR